MNENENSFDENVFKAITALNALMVDPTVGKSSKSVVKINRFKTWLNTLWESESKQGENENNENN